MSTDRATSDDGGAGSTSEALARVIALIDAGELDASPTERAYLAGSLQGLRGSEFADSAAS